MYSCKNTWQSRVHIYIYNVYLKLSLQDKVERVNGSLLRMFVNQLLRSGIIAFI